MPERAFIPNVTNKIEDGQALVVSGKSVRGQTMPTGVSPQADISDMAALTIDNNPLLLLGAAQATSVQASVDALSAKVNAILAALRSAGVLEA